MKATDESSEAERREQDEPVGEPAVADRARRRRRQRLTRRASLIIGLAVVAGFILALTQLIGGDRVVRGVEVAGVSMSGRTRGAALDDLRALATELAGTEIRFEADGRTFTTTPDELGWEPDPEATAESAFGVGRRGAPWRRLWERARGVLGGIELQWVARWDPAPAQALLDRWQKKVGTSAREAAVRVLDGEIRPVRPRPGIAIDGRAVRVAAESLVRGGTIADPIPLPVGRVDPRTDEVDLRAAIRRVDAILQGPIRLSARGESFHLLPADLATLVHTRVKDADDGGRLAVHFPPEAVDAALEPHARRLETSPRDARFDIVGERVRIRPSSSGVVMDPKLVAGRLLDIAVSPDRAGRIELVIAKPEVSTREAKAMGIEDQLSTFTTEHTPGEPRVTNIHLAADLLDGALVLPDTMFSLNERVGPRTKERGFVNAPVIYEGEFTEDVGGGTSQLATTTFNAAFFAGYPFVEYQPHSFYIDRYPMGREATVSYPAPDLKFRNDTAHPFVIATSYTDSSITVSIYGTKDRREITATRPKIVRRTAAGFEVRVERIIDDAKGKLLRRDVFRTFYKNE
jgi:vancomycin resistance protein YoaR